MTIFEAECVEGLEDLLADEVRQLHGATIVAHSRGAVQFSFAGNVGNLHTLKLAQAVYALYSFAVPRPKALLGDQHFRRILSQIDSVLHAWPRHTFKTIHIAAAGAESSVMQRLLHSLAQHTHLQPHPDEGDLWLRIRSKSQEPRTKHQDLRAKHQAPRIKHLSLNSQPSTLNHSLSTINHPLSTVHSWEVLVRLTPRPLATRAWRVCNYEGALNATVARAMAIWSQPRRDEVVLNLLCGSGSLLIERGQWPAAKLMGCDISPAARDCAEQNLRAAALPQPCPVFDWDARQLPLPNHSVDVILSDLPFGQLIGSHQTNATLYPAVLREAARVAKTGGRFVLITHEIRLIEANLAELSAIWQIAATHKVTLRGLHPRIYVLNKI